jgi:hypothetical protein
MFGWVFLEKLFVWKIRSEYCRENCVEIFRGVFMGIMNFYFSNSMSFFSFLKMQLYFQ